MVGGQWAANSPGTVGFLPCAEGTVVKSPWSPTDTQNLQVGGMGDVELGAGVLVHLLATVKVLCPQSSTTFSYWAIQDYPECIATPSSDPSCHIHIFHSFLALLKICRVVGTITREESSWLLQFPSALK